MDNVGRKSRLIVLLSLRQFLRQKRPGIQNVLPHDSSRGLDVMSTDRRIDLLVIIEWLLQSVLPLHGCAAFSSIHARHCHYHQQNWCLRPSCAQQFLYSSRRRSGKVAYADRARGGVGGDFGFSDFLVFVMRVSIQDISLLRMEMVVAILNVPA